MERDPRPVPPSSSPVDRLRGWLPRGGGLRPEQLANRHRWVVRLLWLHVPVALAFGLIRHAGIQHSFQEAAIVAAFALCAGLVRGRKLAPFTGSLGLVVTSSVLVHLSGGATEAHFHFFVAIAVLTLYEEWVPFAVALGYVIAHHGILGKLDPSAVYSSPAAMARPWTWASIHAGFVLAASGVSIIRWKVTEMSRADAQRLAAIVESSPDAIFSRSFDGTIQAWNRGAALMFGYTASEMIGGDISPIVPPERAAEPEELMNRVRNGESVESFRTERLRKDGSRVMVSLSASPIRDAKGNIVGGASIARDVTHQETAERHIREAEERFRLAFDNAPIGMALVALDGRWLKVNRALCDILGYAPEELLATTSQQITHPDDLPSELEHLEQLVADEISHYQIDKRFRHRAGHDVWIKLHASVVRDAAGTPLYGITQVEDITQRKQSEMMLTHMAMHDSLTGLPNRTLALDRLKQALARARRSHSGVAVLFCDLDRFKVINDSLGHAAGDRLLMATAIRLQALLRPSDTVARIGGDEFVLVCEDVDDVEGAERIARRVLAAMVEPFDLEVDQVVVGASVGVALAESGTSAEDLIRDADAAMYRAKETGRNHYELFDASFRSEAVSRLQIEQDLRRAIDRGQFRLHYQPLIDLEDGSTVGVEALLRWEHPTRGTIPPLDFIPLAEDTGLIVPIGTWVIQEACRQAKRWRDEYPAGRQLRIAVNLSARQLAQPDLADVVAGALTETGTDPASLVLEITESVLTDDTDTTIEALRALKALGVRLSVDDFGTGYSSLLYLKRFPVDILKVDRSFVEGLGTDPEDSAIVAGVVGLARTLGLTTVAEGVETEKQLDALRELGCEFGQGFLFAKPQPPDEISVSVPDSIPA